MSIKISGLKALLVVGWLFAGGAAADTPNQQSISGDSGSAAEVASVDDKATKKKKARKKKQKMICRREKVTGSHMRQRVCRTPEQEEARRLADQRAVDGMLSTPAGGEG